MSSHIHSYPLVMEVIGGPQDGLRISLPMFPDVVYLDTTGSSTCINARRCRPAMVEYISRYGRRLAVVYADGVDVHVDASPPSNDGRTMRIHGKETT